MLNIGKPLTPGQRLQKAVVDIMSHDRYIALAGTLMIGDRKLSDDIPTACTNGRDEFYSPEFVEKQTDAQVRYLVLHEVYHKLYKHLVTWLWMFEEDPQLANIACDYMINIRLDDDNTDGFAVMPDGGMIDPKYRGWDSAAIYNDLKQRHGDKSERSNGTGKGNDGRDLEPMPCAGGFDEHDWESAKELTPEQVKELARDLDEAIRQGALLAGKTGSGGNRDLTELLKPQIDWREVLREFVTSTCAGKDYSTWMRPSRRYMGSGYYMPSGISEQVEAIGIAPDMSGSIGQREQTVILSEVAGIADAVKPREVHIMYWDTRVARHEKYTEQEFADVSKSTKPAGGGGTDPACVPPFMQEHNIEPQAAIILTDGYIGGHVGEWNCPTLWVVFDNEHFTSPIGKTLHIKSRDL